MKGSRHNPEGEGWSENGPHGKFLELCAVSTSGALTEEKREDLHAPLAECPGCRQALKEFEAAADVGMPLLHAHLANSDSLESTSVTAETAKVMGATTTVQARTLRTE